MSITKATIKRLEGKFKGLPCNKELPPPIMFDTYKEMHPELTDEQIDEVYKKAGVLQVK